VLIQAPQTPRGLKFVAALGAVSLSAVLSALDQTVVATALPHIMDSLHGESMLGWVFTAYFLGATATVAITGKLADLLGRRRVFASAIVVFALGSLLCGVATSMPMLAAFRGLQGIGAGSIQTCSLIVMADMFSPRERGKWQAVNSIGFATASAIGPTIGGLISDNTTWRWIFLLNVPLCLLTIGALLYGLADVYRPATRPRIDWAGASWSMMMVISLLLALTWGGNQYAWLSPEIGALIAIAVLAGLLLRHTERRAPEPVIPGSLMRHPVARMSSLVGFGNSMVWYGLILLVPLRLQLVLGESATAAGALLTPGIVLGPLCSVLCGQLMSRTGHTRILMVTAGFFMTAGAALMAFLPATASPTVVLLAFMVGAIGCGFGGPASMITFQNAIPHRQMGAGMGMLSLIRQFGSSLGTAVAGGIVGTAAVAATSGALATAVQHAFLIEVAAGAIVLGAALLTADIPLRTTIHDEETGEEVSLSPMLATMEAV
jgi:EmrB/QacA subfamily drug resistance transporter